jgi:PAS domain-containing protein
MDTGCGVTTENIVGSGVAGEPAFASDGRFEGYVGSSVDITDRRQAEDLIRQSEARFRVLFDSDVVPLLYWHQDGRVLDANDAYLRLFGASRDESKQALCAGVS